MKKVVVYKHREVFEFKGVRWKHDKTFGEWHPVGQPYRRQYPTIFSNNSGWDADGGYGKTPLAAIKAWASFHVAKVKSELSDLKGLQNMARARLKKLRAKSWK